jgi:hypothetical protein
MGSGMGIYPQWLGDLGEAGFQKIETFSYGLDVPYTPEAWRGRIRASAGVGGSMSSEEVKEFDEKLAELLAQYFPQEVLQVPHRMFTVIVNTSQNEPYKGMHPDQNARCGIALRVSLGLFSAAHRKSLSVCFYRVSYYKV